MRSAHIAKLDRTLKAADCTMRFQAFRCLPYTIAADALSRPFRLGDFRFFFRLSLWWPFHSSGLFAAVALSQQTIFRCRTSLSLDAAGLSKRHSWFFDVDSCSDAASCLHPPAATFTTLCEYREDSPGYE
jgi:hypothetical protein